MNYTEHYNNLILKAKSRSLTGYCESHHIIPKCMGGSDDIQNLVLLTPEEHYVAHQLLVKMHPTNKSLVYAANMMTVGSDRVVRCNNRSYGWLKRRLSECLSESQSGTGNSQFGTKWMCKDGNNKKVKSVDINEYLDNGWTFRKSIRMCKMCNEHPIGKSMFCSLHKGKTRHKKEPIVKMTRAESVRIANIASTSDSSKANRKKTFKDIKHQQGESNSQFGTCWIHNSEKSVKINKNDLQSYIDSGWVKGRKMI